MPTISVVIPAYNAERTILETIKTVQQQTFSDWEIIVINDGSIDKTTELLQGVVDERLKIFSYGNGGVSVARNRGIAHASGEFIALLDADDLWTPDKLELQLAALQQHPEAGVAYSWTYDMSETGELLKPITPSFQGNIHANLLLCNFISNGSNPLIRKQAIESIGEFCPQFSSTADWDYWLRLAAGWAFVVVPQHQILYRRSSSSMSSKLNTMKQETLVVLEKAFGCAPAELQYLKHQSFSNVYLYYAEVYLNNLNNNLAQINQVLQNLWTAVYLYPQNLFSSYTQTLIIKALLIRILSHKIASRIIQFISGIRKNPLQLQQ